MARFAFGLSLVLLVGSFAFAQDPAAGIQSFSTQIGGPVDSVDIATSNVLIKIPVRSKIGALPFSFALISNSHAYKGPVVAGGSWQLVSYGNKPGDRRGINPGTDGTFPSFPNTRQQK